jgi:hypothetical protein
MDSRTRSQDPRDFVIMWTGRAFEAVDIDSLEW